MIVTIGGEYGCGSKEAARKAAKDLGYTIYDDEIVSEVYRSGGTYLDEATLRYYDESRGTSSIDEIAGLCSDPEQLSGEIQSLSLDVLPLDLRLDAAMSGTLNRLADMDNCIFLGRCANYYLRDRRNVITMFFVDSAPHKKERVMKELDCDAATAERLIKRTDRRRADFYSYFTGEKWDDADNYDVRVDLGLLGEDGSAELIAALVEIKEKQI